MLLCLLGITFFLGSRRGGGAEQYKHCYPNGDATEDPLKASGSARSATNQVGTVEKTSTAQGHGGPPADAGEDGVMQDLRPALASDADGDRKNGAGIAPTPAPLIGGVGQPQQSFRAILKTGPRPGNLGQVQQENMDCFPFFSPTLSFGMFVRKYVCTYVFMYACVSVCIFVWT